MRVVQESFDDLDWVAPVPDYFLHVSAPATASEWRAVEPFTIAYRGVNCFHDAAIVEAHAVGGSPFPPAPYLPHLSLGYFRSAERADGLRKALLPHRGVEFGSGIVDEVVVCDVPIGRSRFFDPWLVVDRIRLEG